MGRPELSKDPRFATNEARVANEIEIDSIVINWVRSHPRTEVLDILSRFAVPSGAVNNAEDITRDAHFRERGSVIPFRSRELGTLLAPGPIARFHRHEPLTSRSDAPAYAEHTQAILAADLRLDEAALSKLAADKIIA